MKHNLKVAFIILGMFIITQLIGLYVVNHYVSHELPLGFQIPQIQEASDFNSAFASIVFAFVIVVFLMFLLSKFKVEFILRLWFFIVVTATLIISFNAFITKETLPFAFGIILVLAILLAYIKVYKRDFIVHNFTELFVYPGVAAVFVQFLNIYTLAVLLILISVYDIWAVWHSGFMQKMAKYQINKLNFIPGFFIPHMSKNLKLRLQKMKKSDLKKKIKVNIAILGGGDVAYTIISSGVVLKTLGPIPALLVIFGAILGLSYILFFGDKKKMYPAMPFISAGIFAAIGISYLVF